MKNVKLKKLQYIEKQIPETLEECDIIDCFNCAYCEYYPRSINLSNICVHRKVLKDMRI